MGKGVVLGEGMARRIAEAVRWVESMRSREGGASRPWRPAGPAATAMVRCTSATADANGNYPAVVTYHDGSAWQDESGTVKLKMAGGTTAVSGRRYLAKPSAEQSGDFVYVSDGGTADFVSYTQIGIVSLADQYLGAGVKSFDSVRVAYTDGSPASTDPRLDAVRSADTGELDSGDGTGLEVRGGTIRRNPLMAASLWVDSDAGEGSWFWRGTGLGGSTDWAYQWWGWRGSSAATTPLADCVPMQMGVGNAAPSAGPALIDTTYGWLKVGGIVEAAYHNVAFINDARFRCRGLDGASGTDLAGSTVTGGIITTIGSALASNAVVTASITDASVTYAKIQNVAADRILGRYSTSGPPQELSAGTGLEIVAGPSLRLANDGVSDAKLRDSAGLSVIGRSANSTGDPADIVAANDGEVLRRSGTSIGFGTVATAGIAADAVTYAKMQNVSAASRLLGRGSASGAGDPEEIALGGGLSMSGTTLSASLDITGLTDADPALDDGVPIYDTSATANRKATIQRVLGLLRGEPGGRLGLTSGDPWTTANTTGTTVYYAPAYHDVIQLWDGTRWLPIRFSEKSLALGTLTSGKNYDVWGYLSSGDLALELSAAWTNDTTRADAVSYQDGRLCKTGAKDRLLLGTIRTSSTTQTTSTYGSRFVSNVYNQIPLPLSVSDSNSSWNYSSTTIRQARASSGNQAAFVCARPSAWWAMLSTLMVGSGGTEGGGIGIGYDSTTTFTHEASRVISNAGDHKPVSAHAADTAAAGYHYLSWNENGHGSGTQTWFGTLNSGGVVYNHGISGEVMG